MANNMYPEQTVRVHSVNFLDKILPEVHLNICSRTSFSGQNTGINCLELSNFFILLLL